MKQKQFHFVIASFALLGFVLLGYCVKFFPEALQSFDTPVQSMIRSNLPSGLTYFFTTITVLGNTSVQVAIMVVIAAIFYFKKWYVEAGYTVFNGLIAAICIISLKNIYQRPRPSITHLVEASGYSFPSGHSMGSMLIMGGLIVVLHRRIQSKTLRILSELLVALLIILIGWSRIYVGVHYLTDVLAGFLLGFGCLHLFYPFYDKKRFEWRFKSKQN